MVEPKPDMTLEEASEIVKNAFGRRPDLPSGKDFVDEIRHGIGPDESPMILDTDGQWKLKPNEDRLLSWMELAELGKGIGCPETTTPQIAKILENIAKAQDAKTASILKAQEQARVERIFKEEIENGMPDSVRDNADWWQEFWKQEE